MGLVEDVEQRMAERCFPKRCKFGALLDSSSPQEKEALEYVIFMIAEDSKRPQDDRIFTIAWLATTLNNNGISIGKTVISDHLRKGCACEQPSK